MHKRGKEENLCINGTKGHGSPLISSLSILLLLLLLKSVGTSFVSLMSSMVDNKICTWWYHHFFLVLYVVSFRIPSSFYSFPLFLHSFSVFQWCLERRHCGATVVLVAALCNWAMYQWRWGCATPFVEVLLLPRHLETRTPSVFQPYYLIKGWVGFPWPSFNPSPPQKKNIVVYTFLLTYTHPFLLGLACFF